MIGRRPLMLGGAIGLIPCLGLRAQQPARPFRIGIPGNTTAAQAEAAYEGLRDELRRLTFVEGRDYVLEFVWAEGRPERLPALARDLVARGVDIIYAVGTEAARAAKDATSTIPIVFATALDPVEGGLVTNVARPGGNITGLTTFTGTAQFTGKLLEALKETIPGLTRVAYLAFPGHPAYARYLSAAKAFGRTLRLVVDAYEFQRAGDSEATFAAMAASRVQAVVAQDLLFFSRDNQARIATLALKHRLPLAVDVFHEAAAAGALFGYGPDAERLTRRVAHYVASIMKGAAPGDLPVEQATHFILAVNLKTAKILGLTVPPSLLARADVVIE